MPEINEVVGEKTAEIVDVATLSTQKPKVREKVKKEVAAEKKVEYVRPAMEMLTRDFEAFLPTLTIDKRPLTLLAFKCGKIIYGLKEDEGKDLRIIGIKARGKHKSVEGKSRCIYYFGTTKDASKLLKDLPGVKNCKVPLGSVQSKYPVELVLDKVTYTEIFDQDIDKVKATLKKISTIAVQQREEQYLKSKTESE
jgi:predicted transcriptional regulator